MNKKVVLYHSSDHIIEKPLFGHGKLYNDYGLGFYCTRDKNLACEWAVSENLDGYANEYSLDVDNLKVLNLNKIQYPILTWLTVLLQNRTFDSYSQVQASSKDFLIKNYNINYSDYDVIVGYRADDSYFQFAKAFLNSAITYNTLVNAMHLGNLGNQYVLKSEKAFSQINFVKPHKAAFQEWFPKKIDRESKARKIYAESRNLEIQSNDILLGDIIRGRLNETEKELLRQGIPSVGTGKSRSDD